jgi:hypothetical protein
MGTVVPTHTHTNTGDDVSSERLLGLRPGDLGVSKSTVVCAAASTAIQ